MWERQWRGAEGSEKERCAEPFSQEPPLKGPRQPRATKEGPSEYIRARSACNDLRASRSTVRRGGLGFFDRSTISVTVEEDPEEEERSEEEVSCSHLINDRHHFSVADPIGASTTHDGEYSFGFLSWLARDLGASIDYAKSRLKSGFRPRGSSTFCLVKPKICTSPQIGIDCHMWKTGRTLPKRNQIHSRLLTHLLTFALKESDYYKKFNLQLPPLFLRHVFEMKSCSTFSRLA